MMGLFSSIKDKIFGHKSQEPVVQRPSPTPSAPMPAPATAAPTPTPSVQQPTAPTSQQVDVGAVLSEMATMKGGGGNYRSSIVDLLKLLDLDSDLQARKELADDLGVRAGADGSAEQNIALHRAVMAKLAENGGIVPDDLRS